MKQHLLAVLSLIAINGCGAYAGTEVNDPEGAGASAAGGGAKSGDTTAVPGAPAPPAAPSSPECLAQASSLQTALDKLSANDGNSNMTIGVVTPHCGKQIIVSGNKSEVTPTSLHRIGSVTKTFVSALILTLVKNNKLALTDTLSKYLPNTQLPNASSITIHQLLNQTSGVANYTGDDDFKQNPQRKWLPTDLVAIAASQDSSSSPGSSFHFSDTNYILLGMIAEKVGGGSVAQQIRTNLLQPAALSSTFFDGQETLVGTLAPGFDFDSSANTTYARDPSGWWAAGAMVATPSDLLDWTSGLYGSALLGASTVTTMVDSGGTKMGDDYDTTYGLGVVEYPASAGGPAGASLGHDSSVTGYSTQAAYFADKQTNIVAIVDENSGDTNAMIRSALQVLFP